jgi:hypothetical protein
MSGKSSFLLAGSLVAISHGLVPPAAKADTQPQITQPISIIDQYTTVEIPASTIATSYSENLKVAPSRSSYLELGASSWAPSSFSLPGSIPAQSSYQGNSLPSFFLNYLTQVKPGSDFSIKLGANWLSLTRNGDNPAQGMSGLVNENVQLLSLRVGAEYAPAKLSNKYVAPYVSAALLPSAAFEPSSAFNNNGDTYFGIPVEFTAGGRVQLDSLGLHLSGAEFVLAAVGTAGTIDHSSVAGFGINGGFRLAL